MPARSSWLRTLILWSSGDGRASRSTGRPTRKPGPSCGAPQGAKVFRAVLLALTPDKDRDAAWHESAKNVNQFGLRIEDLNGFRAAATAYEKAMVDVQQEIATYQAGLPAMAEDVQRRASALMRMGQSVETSFRSLISSPIAGVPLVYYELLGLCRTSQVLLEMSRASWGPRRGHQYTSPRLSRLVEHAGRAEPY